MSLLPPEEPVHLLDPDGTLHEDPEYPVGLEDEALVELHRTMIVTRRIDREAINLQRQGQLGVYASCLGQEAAQVASAWALQDEDWIFPSYRELGAAIVRDVDPADLLHLFRGTWLSDHDPYEHRFALLSIPIGTQALHATGFAMGARFDGNPIVTVVYFGDGGTSEGDPHEAMTFAGVMRSPVVFFVQNNQYAISVPLSKQTAAPTLAHKAIGYGLPGYRCDGNDPLATYAVTRRAVERARAGHGPALIEALTYRMEAHTTSDDASRYRSDEELEAAALTDPIARLRNHLRRRDLLDDAMEQRFEEEAAERAQAVRDAIYDAPHGDPLELFDHVYVAPRADMAAQRDELRAELARREDDDGGAA
ncbi:MAG: pyruvate dehydrogenase (acetyl-transferring) E1 component subunit alpha [Nitriliruptor sp.]|nr:MAG: pyruvate dehydrogenase (acetyl-transferring) E1 component subunit alpha [Nitriliruptor sp.]